MGQAAATPEASTRPGSAASGRARRARVPHGLESAAMKLAVVAAVLALGGAVSAQVTERLSVDSSGGQGNGGGDLPSPPDRALSADGRFAAFFSPSSNLVS